MRTTLLITLLFCITVAKAQTFWPGGLSNYTQPQTFSNITYPHDSLSQKKWFFSRYSGISTGVAFFKGGNATFVGAPMSLQLNRRLNINWYAFANVAAAPAYTNFNSFLLSNNYNKANQNAFYNSKGFGMYSSASLGLMYVNENKTFSISGSVGVEKNNYPMAPFYPAVTRKPNPVAGSNR